MRIEKILQRCAAVAVASAVWTFGAGALRLGAQSKTKTEPVCCGAKKLSASSKKARARFAARVEALLGTAPTNKGEWGLLLVDAESGETLYERNADKYFVPASNMKLFTTALALAKLGPEYRFHTTLETRATISREGVLGGDLALVGRGDPNLSNRKFPYELKEEFDGPPEKALGELADAVVAKGVKEISGDVIGDDSYFPRERYPNGWEIDDMMWEYGAAISAIVVDDNTVALTLTPGEQAGNAVQAAVTPGTPDFTVENDVVTSAADVKPDLTLTREPGANIVGGKGSLRARSPPRKLVSKISQNRHPERLLRTVARQSGVWATPDELMKVPADFYTAAGIAPGDVMQADASGLSRHNLVTPRAIVTLLGFAQKQAWFGLYYASLPVAGVDGTLEDRMKNSLATGRIHAKTGSVEHVRTLSGFAETPDGRQVIFSFLSNNQGGKSHEAADALTGLCVAMIEEFNVKPPKRGREHKQPRLN